jgi:hypothetical protein
MLLVEERFKDFINDEIADATRSTEAINCLSADSRKQVDETVAKAIAAGGKAVEAGNGRGPDVRRKLPGPRRSRLGAAVHGAVASTASYGSVTGTGSSIPASGVIRIAPSPLA